MGGTYGLGFASSITMPFPAAAASSAHTGLSYAQWLSRTSLRHVNTDCGSSPAVKATDADGTAAPRYLHLPVLRRSTCLSCHDASSARLSWNWSGAYTFALGDGVWSATAVEDPATVLTAESAEELRRLVRADYGKASRRAQACRAPVTDYPQERMST
jgi:hypothetical protein